MADMHTSNQRWMYWLLLVLGLEKVCQHAFVTMAFVGDSWGMRESVEVDYRWLVLTGALIGVLYAVAVTGLLRGQAWSFALLSGLAAADIVGEFIAQATLDITITVSFIVAGIILALAVIEWRAVRTPTNV